MSQLSLHVPMLLPPLFVAVGTPFAFQNPNIGPPESRIAECIAQGIDRGIEIAEIVGDVPEKLRNRLFIVG